VDFVQSHHSALLKVDHMPKQEIRVGRAFIDCSFIEYRVLTSIGDAQELLDLLMESPEFVKQHLVNDGQLLELIHFRQMPAKGNVIPMVMELTALGRKALNNHRTSKLSHAVCLSGTGPLGLTASAFMAFCKRRESVRRAAAAT
jgi:hypothetical protein